MTVYARSDLCYVGISRDHGGCGESHSRPVVEGAPAKLWALTCHQGCEDHLRKDPLWSSIPTAIPETADEQATREDVERRGAAEQAHSTASALEQLAKLGDLPAVMGQFMQFLTGSGTPAVASAIDQLCRNGHRNPPEAQFCSQCGVSTGEAVPVERGPELPARPTAVDPRAGEEEADLEAMSLGDLRALAERRGVKTTRSKSDQIALLREAATD